MPKVEKQTFVDQAVGQEPAEAKVPKKIARKKHKGLATFFIIIVVVAVLSIGLETVVTTRTQGLAAAQIDASLNTDQIPVVIISMHPILFQFINGWIDSVHIEATGFRLKYGTMVETATIDLKGLKFDPLTMIRQKGMDAIKSVDSGTARIVLSEEAVNILVAERLPGGTVKLEKGGFRYISEIPYLLPGVTIDVSGDVTVMPDNMLRFKPKPGELEKLDIPQDIKDYLIGALVVDYKLEDVPLGFEITKVTPDAGRVTLDADIVDLSFLTRGVTGVKD